jgi:hypothetical protein
MPKVQPKGDLRGVLLPESATLTATYSASSEAGPRAGPVVPNQTTGLNLHSAGELDASSRAATGDTIELATTRGGNVGTATFRWKYSGENYRSYDPPVMVAGWEFVDRTATANRYRRPHVVRRASTGLLAASVSYDSNTVKAWRQDHFGKWSSTTVEDTGDETCSCLVDLPSGRLVCVYTVSSAGKTQLRSAYSDDGGATWTTGTSAGLDTPITAAASEVRRVRAVYLAGQVSLVVWTHTSSTDTILQYVSADGGNQWAQVEEFSSADMAYPDMCVSQGSIFVAALKYDSTLSPTVRPVVYRLASAGQPLSSTLEHDAQVGNDALGTYSGTIFTDGELAILGADDGTLYLYGLDFSSTREVGTYVSVDRGLTWSRNWYTSHGGTSGTALFWTGATSTGWRGLTVAPERGRAVMLHTFAANVPNDDTSICAAYLGGWSSVGMPDPATGEAWECGGWDTTWLPIDKPQDCGTAWTRTTSGAGTSSETLGSTGFSLATTGSLLVHYQATPVTTGYEKKGILAEFHILHTSGTPSALVRISDGTNCFSVRVDVTASQVDFRDVNAGTSIGTYAIDVTKGTCFRVSIDNPGANWTTNVGRARVWVRTDGPYTGGLINYGPRQDRLWAQVASSTSLTSAAGTSNLVDWGNVTAIGDATWRWAFFSAGREAANNIASTSIGAIRGAIVPPAGSPMHIASGLRVFGVDGPSASGDTYTTTAAHEYPISAVNPSVSPSPRRQWRSTTATQQDIKLTGLDMGARSGDVWGLYIAGANWRTATLYRDTTATNKVVDVDLGKGLSSLAYTRTRDLVFPSAGGSGSDIYFPEGALVGASMRLGSGQVRKVAGNTSGAWGTTGTASYASTRIQLDSYDAGDPTSGTGGLWLPRGLVLFDNLVSTDELMLRIGTQDVADGYFSIGTMLLGRVRFFGRQYSRGRSVTFTPAYELFETRSGARRARALGPTRRAVEIAWDDGIDTTGLYSLPSTAPDYYTLGYTGADAIAAPADTALTLAGVIRSTQGAVLPTVLISAVKQQTSSPGTAGIHLLNPEAHLYGRIATDSLRIDSDANIAGDELRDPGEVVTVGSVRFEEEV